MALHCCVLKVNVFTKQTEIDQMKMLRVQNKKMVQVEMHKPPNLQMIAGSKQRRNV